ncbi:hypothetical protein GIB67_037987 [Kingdonia uniflora]|uniref:DUF1421 domain-containing protein n=1 Tax=Kingdonia uniflora TaxID=39325 RepID=A0A7J7LHK0_9MAGN|nr:hypothetical protein GIB67_037987 [Kingdonia uniflora]
MASGPSGRTGSGSRGFDFGSDDVLCSYDDMVNQDGSNGKHTDPMIRSDPGKDFRDSRMGKSTLLPAFNPQEESVYQDVIATVEKTMKKYADNLLRFLEGISSRLSQLELYCYNLEKSVGEMRSDLSHENSEADSKLRSLEKHLQEVHRSVQILRDKQELADTQKELAKLQLSKKGSSSGGDVQQKEEVTAPISDPRKHDSTQETQNQQLALALPHQVNPQASLPIRPMDQQPQPMAPSSQTLSQNIHAQTQQPNVYYPQQNQYPGPPVQSQNRPQDQYVQADSQYQRPQNQAPPQPAQPLQSLQVHPYPMYPQQWPQQFSQQQSPPQAQIAAQPPTVYPPFPQTQPANPAPDIYGSMQIPRSEPMGYGYGSPGGVATTRPKPQPQPHQNTFGAPAPSPVDNVYPVSGSHPTQGQRQGYMMYDGGEGGRVNHPLPPHYLPGGGYPPQAQNQTPIRQPSPSQLMRNHPYGELIEKAVSMGYGREYVANIIQRMEESGQTVDLNSVLDRLNSHSSGGSQRAW